MGILDSANAPRPGAVWREDTGQAAAPPWGAAISDDARATIFQAPTLFRTAEPIQQGNSEESAPSGDGAAALGPARARPTPNRTGAPGAPLQITANDLYSGGAYERVALAGVAGVHGRVVQPGGRQPACP